MLHELLFVEHPPPSVAESKVLVAAVIPAHVQHGLERIVARPEVGSQGRLEVGLAAGRVVIESSVELLVGSEQKNELRGRLLAWAEDGGGAREFVGGGLG